MTEKEVNDMRSEYDFSAGVRGKHHRAMQKGYTVTIHQSNGSTLVKEMGPKEGIVILDPDVQEYFPDLDSVNDAVLAIPGSSGKET